ncbi:CGI-12 PROTEIN-RELATED [Salix koriyanagi]|uniref:CGI-12 PROTEIN-RELATED n=1 Tax=Salix koriyanagi TaxID=2511006 RepID=A0A9Q0PUZ0_9ROSI|nr:CGI-12 PROTEIN-RELATED [Salix koriyanagi]
MGININGNLPLRNLLLSLIQKRFLKTSSTSQPPNASSSPSSFTVHYLINSCGLPLQSALSVSKKIQIDENNTQKPQCVIQFLKSYDFQDTHIAKLIEKWPAVLRSRTEDNLKPKFDFFITNGFVGQLLPQLVVLDPVIFRTSLDTSIKPCFELLKRFLKSNENILAALSRAPFLMSFSFNATVRPNLDLLKKQGVTADRVAKLLLSQPRSLQHSNDRMVYAVNYLKQLGIEPHKRMYIHALTVIARMNESAWRKKIDMFKSVGWTEEEVLWAFKRYPCLLLISEEKIRSMMDFFLNNMKLERQTIVANPALLKYSFGNRVLPRCNVLKVLKSKTLIKGDTNIATFLKLSEKDFMERCVTKYEDKVPGLLEMYRGIDKGKDGNG